MNADFPRAFTRWKSVDSAPRQSPSARTCPVMRNRSCVRRSSATRSYVGEALTGLPFVEVLVASRAGKGKVSALDRESSTGAPANPHSCNRRTAAKRVEKIGVAAGRLQAERHDVGGRAGAERAGAAQAQGGGASAGGGLDDGGRRDRRVGRAEPRHLGEEVEGVVGGEGVGAEREGEAGAAPGAHGRLASVEEGVRAGAMHRDAAR